MAVDLPMEREPGAGGSQSSTDSASTRHGPPPAPAAKGPPSPDVVVPRAKDTPGGVLVGGAASASDNYSYVQLTTVHHEYIYPPVVDDRRDSLKKRNFDNPLGVSSTSQPPLPAKKKDRMITCRHCQVSMQSRATFDGVEGCGTHPCPTSVLPFIPL